MSEGLKSLLLAEERRLLAGKDSGHPAPTSSPAENSTCPAVPGERASFPSAAGAPVSSLWMLKPILQAFIITRRLSAVPQSQGFVTAISQKSDV